LFENILELLESLNDNEAIDKAIKKFMFSGSWSKLYKLTFIWNTSTVIQKSYPTQCEDATVHSARLADELIFRLGNVNVLKPTVSSAKLIDSSASFHIISPAASFFETIRYFKKIALLQIRNHNLQRCPLITV